MGNVFSAEENADRAEGCNIYKHFRRSQNNSFLGISGYEGIPQNFVVNISGWFVLIALFIFLRKRAWNYGRVAVMQKNETNWTEMLFEDLNDEELSIDDTVSRIPIIVASSESEASNNNATVHQSSSSQIEMQVASSQTQGAFQSNKNKRASSAKGDEDMDERNYNLKNYEEGEDRVDINNDADEPPKQSYLRHQKIHVSEIKDKGYFAWMKILYSLTDEQYIEKCGEDCVHYLSFQRHLILLASIITVSTLTIILPVNLRRSYKEDRYEGFADTTIINLDQEHDFLWLHNTFAIVYFIISVIIMRHFSKRLQFVRKRKKEASQSIMIIGLHRKNCREDLLRAHFSQAYPQAEIQEISFAYNISKLYNSEFNRLTALSAKLYFMDKFRRKGSEERPRIRPYNCGICNCDCYGWCEETDAIHYYTKQERKHAEVVEMERQRTVSRPLGMAFVTFGTPEDAEIVVEDYNCSSKVLLMKIPISEYTSVLRSNRWSIKFAPRPEEIYWQNLSVNIKLWYAKFCVVNVVLAFIVIIFTTPVYLFSTFAGPNMMKHKYHEHLNSTPSEHEHTDPHGHTVNLTEVEVVDHTTVFTKLILDTLPPLIVCVLGILQLSVVSSSDTMIGFWTKTSQNLSEMTKTFIFLIFMVIVLPSLGVTSFSYFLNIKNGLSWSCIFFKENGALFVNYLITSSLMGTGAELMRLPELLLYVVKVGFARSKAEIGAIRKSILWEFPIGIYYAWVMLHFTIMTSFCVIYPLVTPFGLLYLIMKHWTDRYNIYFAYAPCKVDKSVHRTAMNFVMMSMFMLFANLLAYIHLHLGENQNGDTDLKEARNPHIRALQVFSLLSFAIAASLFLGEVCFNICEDFSPIYFEYWKGNPITKNESEKLNNTEERNNFEIGATTSSTVEVEDSDLSVQRQIQEININRDPLVPRNVFEIESQSDNKINRVNPATAHRKPYGRYIPPLLKPEFCRIQASSKQEIDTTSKLQLVQTERFEFV